MFSNYIFEHNLKSCQKPPKNLKCPQMKILITGGAGFIGSNFVRHVLQAKKKWQVVNLDALTYAGNLENLAGLETQFEKRYQFLHGDISNFGFLKTLFEKEKFDGVIHFAAQTHVDRSIEDAEPFIKTNINGTHFLLECATKFKVDRFHHVSTDEVYGDAGEGSTHFFTENTPIEPNCPYAASKAASDLLVQSWHRTHGLNTIITRCSNNYGPFQFPEKLIPFFLFRAMQNLDVPVYGDGGNVRDWLFVLDHCEAILRAFCDSEGGEVWNIGGNNEKTNLEIAELILKSVPSTKSKIKFVADRKAHDRRYAIDATKIQTKLGWHPAHTFEDALPKTIQWYLANEKWVAGCRQKI